MKNLLLVLIGAVVIFGGLFLWKHPMATVPVSGTATTTELSDMVTYTDPNGQFQFTAPQEFVVTGSVAGTTTEWMTGATTTGSIIGGITVPRSYMPHTNFDDATLTLGRSSDPVAIRTCLVDTSGLGAQKEKGTISGFPFSKFTFTEAAAGNRYETTSYRGILDGDCYALEYTIHSGNIANYPPESGIQEFDKEKIVSEFEAIMKSFKILVNSD
ncbi:MAG: hypothetical protein V4465_00920 [Patescibacteria group bacterium]